MRINLTKKDLVNSVYMQIGFSKQISENLIEEFFSLIVLTLKKKRSVKISKFGTFSIRSKKSRIGVSSLGVSNLKHNTNYDSHEILEEFKNNEKRAIEALDNYIDHLARGLSLVCNILDPDIIVLGGGMSNISYIYDHINTSLKKYIFSDTFNTKVVKNIHGDSGGVRGAAWLS